MIDTSKIYSTKSCGDLKIINYKDALNVTVEFIDTGYKVSVAACAIMRGQIKDRLKPSIFGIGVVGVGRHAINIKRIPTRIFSIWQAMIGRCYDAKVQEKCPTYKDCTVCDEWHNFQNFADWYELNYIEGYQLDKDIKIDGNRVYSPETCLFVSCFENSAKASNKKYVFTCPFGESFDVYHLQEFCDNNELCRNSMYAVNSGRLNQHKGWTKSIEVKDSDHE